jgi:predicted alpha/beta-hydrolase family hydrolase
MNASSRELSLHVSDTVGDVDAILESPPQPFAAYVFAHGAGAGMRHAFIEAVARDLHAGGVATLRYQFPYMHAGKHRPDPPARLEATVRAAVEAAAAELPGVALFAGGKSMGGRMSSQAAAAGLIDRIHGLAFLGFPLHPPGRDGVKRAAHLAQVAAPMLFVQGTRDDLANLELMRDVCDSLGARATLHVVDGGDQSFKVLKRSGRTSEDVMAEIISTMVSWMRDIIAR